MKLKELFDGEMHLFEPGVDFAVPASAVVIEFAELDEEEELDPYESPDYEVVMEERPAVYGKSAPPTPDQQEQSAWGGLAVALGSFSHIMEVDRHCHQRNQYTPDGKALVARRYEYRMLTKEFRTRSTGWEGGLI